MDQCRMTKDIVDWIRNNPWKPNNIVRYDGSCSNPDTPDAEHCSLYLGVKESGKGWTEQIVQVDILTEESTAMTVDLLIELEPELLPKKIFGEVLPILLADNYTPSGLVGAAKRQIKDAVFIFATVVPDKEGSQKRSQLLGLEETIIRKLDFHKLAIRTVKFCVGNSEADAVQQCKNAIEELFKCDRR